jgi:hypothetical protein
MTFSGTTNTDFMKLASIPERKKQQYIDFGGTDFYTLKENLISYIKAVYPLDYQNFSESDLGVMLVEVVAYMGAVLSLKGDMLANENYLRTVKNRNNAQKLFELIGVDLKGPISAAANAKLTAKTSTTGEFPITFSPASRVFSILSKEDGSPVSYTLYKVVDGTVEDIQNANSSFSLNSSEADNAASSVFTNVTLLEGAYSVQEGNFDTLEGNKRVLLTQSPIVEGSVQVFVQAGEGNPAQGAYKQVDRLFSASGVNDKVYQVVYDDDYAATLLFGDNIMGVSPPAGAAFTIGYRVGGGTRGNITNGAINVVMIGAGTSNDITFTTENISAATGGSDSETLAHAKKYAPYTFKRQDRVVTLEDYITISNTFRSTKGTIGKSTAVVRDAFSSGNVIDVYTLEKADELRLQKASPTFKKELLAEIEPKKMITDEVVVCDGLIRTLDVAVTIRVDKELDEFEPQIQQEVATVILNYFDVDNTDFGEAFNPAHLNRKIFELPNVRFSSVDNIETPIIVDFHEIIQLNNFTIETLFI